MGNPICLMMASSPPMRDLRRWILVGLAVAVVSVAAIGYGLIARNVAAPISGDLGTLAVPGEREAIPVTLADGRPVFIVRTADAVHVIDARVPLESGTSGRLAAWCDGGFVDLAGVSSYTADGGLVAGDVPSGLVRYPITRIDERTVRVGRDAETVGAAAPDDSVPLCEPSEAVVHEPEQGETFDPSVAVDEEPPGWIWLDGRLEAIGGQALLCDGLDETGCRTGAAVPGIDPAKLAAEPAPLAGLFYGRVGDGVLDELYFVPQPEARR